MKFLRGQFRPSRALDLVDLIAVVNRTHKESFHRRARAASHSPLQSARVMIARGPSGGFAPASLLEKISPPLPPSSNWIVIDARRHANLHPPLLYWEAATVELITKCVPGALRVCRVLYHRFRTERSYSLPAAKATQVEGNCSNGLQYKPYTAPAPEAGTNGVPLFICFSKNAYSNLGIIQTITYDRNLKLCCLNYQCAWLLNRLHEPGIFWWACCSNSVSRNSCRLPAQLVRIYT